jgi:glycerol-3-phosphate O-acyltransferase
VDRFHRENTVLTSHVVAFALFEALRKAYPDQDLFRFLRLSPEQRTMPFADFLVQAEDCLGRIRAVADRGGVFIARELQHSDTRKWVEDGIRQLGAFHGSNVAATDGSRIWTDDVSLLYYYRNRLSGYGLSLLSQEGARGGEREYGSDAKGFLA